jgi:hypothetical protein
MSHPADPGVVRAATPGGSVRLIVDIVGFQITWWASALGAGAGRWEPGVAAAAIVILFQLAMSATRGATLAAILAALLMGLAGETAMMSAGLVRYAADWPVEWLPPLWLLGLWMVFATCIEATARMLGSHTYLKGALLGAVLAPPTYWAGQSFGALTLAEPIWLPLFATAAVWAIATPLMLAIFKLANR